MITATAHEDGSMTVFFDGMAPTLKDQLAITAVAEEAQKLRELNELQKGYLWRRDVPLRPLLGLTSFARIP